ncbi:thermonuclease family protein [[Mycoplasma] mobile]|nr:thermonuclease family protein [[Mycoplasma] mobile]
MFLLKISISFLFIISCSTQNENFYKDIKSIEILDGDTLSINSKQIRLFGVDTPEKFHYWENNIESNGLEYFFAIEAKKFTESFFNSLREIIISPKSKDKFGRLIARIQNNKKDLALEIIKNGLGIVQYVSLDKKSPFFTRDTNYFYSLLEAQNIAIKLKKGFWQFENISIKTIFPNPNVNLI